jgi:hypothetical protein
MIGYAPASLQELTVEPGGLPTNLHAFNTVRDTPILKDARWRARGDRSAETSGGCCEEADAG